MTDYIYVPNKIRRAAVPTIVDNDFASAHICQKSGYPQTVSGLKVDIIGCSKGCPITWRIEKTTGPRLQPASVAGVILD